MYILKILSAMHKLFSCKLKNVSFFIKKEHFIYSNNYDYPVHTDGKSYILLVNNYKNEEQLQYFLPYWHTINNNCYIATYAQRPPKCTIYCQWLFCLWPERSFLQKGKLYQKQNRVAEGGWIVFNVVFICFIHGTLCLVLCIDCFI